MTHFREQYMWNKIDWCGSQLLLQLETKSCSYTCIILAQQPLWWTNNQLQMPWGEKRIACRNLTSLSGSQRTLYNSNGSCYNSHQMLLNALNKSGLIANHAQGIVSQICLQIINFQFLQITTFCTYKPHQKHETRPVSSSSSIVASP